MGFEIKSGIPISGKGTPSRFEPLLEMKKGDCVTLKTIADCDAARKLFYRHDMDAAVRKQKDGTFMLWRIS